MAHDKAKRREYDRKRYLRDKDRILAWNAAWRAANPEYLHDYYLANRERILAKNGRWTADNPHHNTNRLRAKNGWETGRFIEYMDAQEGCCAICGDPFTSTRDTHADHDHGTLTPRGILCRACNNGIGNFRDDPERLRLAIEYLSEWSNS